jgi:co-chaperonin GroES (HSP10)
MKIRAIRDQILFQFVDRVNAKGQFEEAKSKGGIMIIGGFDDSAKQSRWVKVVSIGPDVNPELGKPGIELLIENLKWTAGVKFEGQTLWKTDESMVLAVRDVV